jgi:hypothetical protein
MKSTTAIWINKFKNSIISLLFIDILLFLCYNSYCVKCEPCLPEVYCEPCICDEQYFIAYFGCCLNIIWLIYSCIRNRKSKQLKKIDKISMCVYFVLVNTLLYLLFKDFQPICEHCLDNTDYSLCMSKEQSFIIHFGIAINIIFGIFCVFKQRRIKLRKQSNNKK